MGFVDDLQTGVNMFTKGAHELGMQRAIANANEQTQQIKASEGDEMQKRAQLQQVANQMVMHLAASGTPDTTIESLRGAIGPKNYTDENQMFIQGTLSGDKGLIDASKQLREEKFQLANKMALAEAKRNPLAQFLAQDKISKENATLFDKLGTEMSTSRASSRSAFGKIAAVDQGGERISALMGDPSHWMNMSPKELQLATEGMGAMVKGGVLGKEESQMLQDHFLKLTLAKGKAYAAGSPQYLDLSKSADLISNIIGREQGNAKAQELESMIHTANSQALLHDRSPDQFKLTVSKSLAQVGKFVDPATIKVNPKTGVTIPGVTDLLDAADHAAPMTKKAYADLRSDNAAVKAKAAAFFEHFGITPDMPLPRAVELIRKRTRASIFEQ